MDLETYLIKEGISKTDFGKLSGLNKNTITALCAKRIKPSVKTLHILGKCTDGLVGPQDFVQGEQ